MNESELIQRELRRDEAFLRLVLIELEIARQRHGPMTNPTAAYAVVANELEEFWSEVRQPEADRSASATYLALVRVAAMACRTAIDLNLQGLDPLR